MNAKGRGKVSISLGLLLFSTISRAGCSVTGGTYNYTETLPTQTISVPINTPEGTAIGNVMAVNNGQNRYIFCSADPYAYLKFGTALTPSNIPGIYKTNMDGIGIKIWSDYVGTVIVDNDIKLWFKFSDNSGSVNLRGIKAQYYVIGPIAAGEVSTPDIVVEDWANNSATTSGGALYNKLTMRGTAIVKAASCETPNITVNLDKHDSAEFSGINSKSAAKNFNFEIKNCSSGMNSVNYTFAPAAGVTLQQAGNANQYITLDASSTASGVGIQVLYNDGSIVPFNSKIKYTGYSKTTGGSYTIPMKARYIQTASNISGGTANSAVEFTMSYE